MESTAEKKVERYGISGSAMDLFGGLAAVIITILGLVGIRPSIMVAVASIAIGAALMAESGSYASEYSRLLAYGGKSRATESELGAGLGAEAVAGLVAVVLGVLALVGITPQVLMASSVIVLGAGIMFGSGVNDRIRALRIETEREEWEQKVTRQAVATAEGAQLMVGISAVVLGILALVGFAPMTLILVGLLATGSSLLLSGASMGARFYSAFRHA